MAKQQTTAEKWELSIEDVFDMPIAYHRVFAFWVGVCGSVFLSQAIYWSKRTSNPEGWFYKTRDEWTLETGLTRREQETARRDAINAGFLEEKLAGNPAKMHYRVNLQPLLEKLSRAESDQLVGTKRTNKKEQNVPTLHTENTTEITKENNDRPIINDEELQEEFDGWKSARKTRKQNKGRGVFGGRGFGTTPGNSLPFRNDYPDSSAKKGVAFGEDIP